mmetsp:Transcript_11352/g.18500  ORF Transcript_11352/g.18500 Transcript_11352/m.18500 type:complete len:132 (-) Transcript_11352:240-635(-)
MSIPSGSLYFKDTFFNGKKGYIKGTTTKIKDKNVALSFLLVKTVRNCSSSWLVDDTKNVKSSNNSSILGSLTLGIVKVRRYSNNSVFNLLSKVGFSNLLHLDENHGRNLLSSKLLLLTLVLNTHKWLVVWS